MSLTSPPVSRIRSKTEQVRNCYVQSICIWLAVVVTSRAGGWWWQLRGSDSDAGLATGGGRVSGTHLAWFDAGWLAIVVWATFTLWVAVVEIRGLAAKDDDSLEKFALKLRDLLLKMMVIAAGVVLAITLEEASARLIH